MNETTNTTEPQIAYSECYAQVFSRIFFGDCLIESDKIESGSVDLILTDLPYGTTQAKWDSIIPLENMWSIFKRILKPNGAIVLFGSQPFTSKLILSNIDWFKEELIWSKDRASNFANAKYRHLKYHENILVFAENRYTYNRQMIERKSERVQQGHDNNYTEKSRKKREDGNEICFNTNYEGRSFKVYDANVKNPSSVINNPIVVPNSKEKVAHPTQKPVNLLEYLIKTYSNENETVFDLTMGSGSTGVACKNTNRNFIGIEKDERYFKIAEQRINARTLFS